MTDYKNRLDTIHETESISLCVTSHSPLSKWVESCGSDASVYYSGHDIREEDISLIQEHPKESLSESCSDTHPQLLSSITDSDRHKLIEITDNNLLNSLISGIPDVAKAVANSKAIVDYKEAVKSAGQLYKVVIPNGATLSNSKDMDGAVRGMYRTVEGKLGHANLFSVDADIGKNVAGMAAVNAAFSIASVVVGQYYMEQINKKLDSISDEIKAITDFLDDEYRSKVYALVSQLQRCAVFKYEIVNNEELRKNEQVNIKALERTCAQLLEQACLSLQRIADEKVHEYSKYKKYVVRANSWYQYQCVLLETMRNISELNFALYLGTVSKEYCFKLFNVYSERVEATCHQLAQWHQRMMKRIGVDLDKSRRRHEGRIVNGFLWLPSRFNKNLKYTKISKGTNEMIAQQIREITIKMNYESDNIFEKDVQLIAENGKLYYLPSV